MVSLRKGAAGSLSNVAIGTPDNVAFRLQSCGAAMGQSRAHFPRAAETQGGHEVIEVVNDRFKVHTCI